MKVRTIRKHQNGHAPTFIKQNGRKYELPERDAKRLIAAGLVEEDKPKAQSEPDED